MPRRVKEEDRIEMIIRGLLKQTENRRCINCNSLGPQYVCTTFWTFVCTNCSGVHREFTHRVKSVSMAKFSEEEITALQAGGNEDSRSNSSERRSYEKSNWSTVRDDFLERPSSERTSNSSRDDFSERTSFEKSSPFKRNGGITFRDILEERSPRYNQEFSKSSGSNRNLPARFEIVDDRFRDDGSVKHYDRYSNKEPRAGSRSPGSRRSAPTSIPPIRSVKEVFGEKIPALKIGGPPKINNEKEAEGSATSQNAASVTIPGPTSANQKQNNTVNPSSLIDFDAKPEPTNNNAEEPQAITPTKNDNESISIASSTTTQVTSNAPNTNSLESLLFDWSIPASSPSAGTSQMSTAAQMNSSTATDVGTTKAAEVSSNVGALSVAAVQNDQPLDDNRKDPTVKVTPVHQMPSKQQNQTLSNNSPASNDLKPVQNVPLEQSSQGPDSGHGSKPTARKEIPQDLFASNFTSCTPAVAGWQMHRPQGLGYGMQFRPPAMSVAAFPNHQRPNNPFDIGDDRFQVQSAIFPSMSPLQGALPNMPPTTALVSQPSPYATPLASHMSPYGMNMPLVPGAYMGQLPNNMPLTRPQGTANLGKSDDAFASLNPIQQTSGTDSSPNSSLSRLGNPFG
ncbi:hypothetical protein DH2020_001976 [Rehmannia glutinosa]|uniref:Arf-GAP domain-containing protein n=1 Tax=Rehmannia glutinosa TaxID=99300 RepID=A0ABR0XSX1_REHGL